ncbi:hypothetical protein A6R68_16227 [Neotoma lepida]|uniref:Uncharacterized protein n=1 Tax=Neotoma lepida TaxID=56216 RepID=A0A1A6HI33_NEOLE|nr:hypothetical protein A6R68_16227 [Neotoma lepida]
MPWGKMCLRSMFAQNCYFFPLKTHDITCVKRATAQDWPQFSSCGQRSVSTVLFCCRSGLDRQDDDKSFRRAPSWRKKFRPKDIRGLASGSAETLPANFRVTSSMSSPSMQPKKVQMDGMWWALQPPHVGSVSTGCIWGIGVRLHAQVYLLFSKL